MQIISGVMSKIKDVSIYPQKIIPKKYQNAYYTTMCQELNDYRTHLYQK